MKKMCPEQIIQNIFFGNVWKNHKKESKGKIKRQGEKDAD